MKFITKLRSRGHQYTCDELKNIPRITPFLPNWFINIVSPVIDVALKPFWFGTFIGVAPPSFVAIQVCQQEYELKVSSQFTLTDVSVFAIY